MRYDPLRISLDCNFEWNGCGTSNFALWLYSIKPMCYVLLCILLCMSCSCFVHRCAPLALPSFLHLSLFVHFSLFVSLSLFLLLYFYETTLSSSPDPIHFILLYILRYYFCTRVIILYTCVCIPVLVVISSIVYNLHHIMSPTLSFYFLRSSYRPAQSRNLCVVVILIMYLCQLFQLLHYG